MTEPLTGSEPAGGEHAAAGAAADRPVRAAGAVVWRPGPTGIQVALIHRERHGDWAFPKGKCEPGEHLLETAVREVAEETGLQVALGRPLRQTRYARTGRLKVVHYWAAAGGAARDGGAAAGFVPNGEVDALEWVPIPVAMRQLTYSHDAAMLAMLASGPVQTAPLMLVRHASAGRKSQWSGPDLDRPLDAQGAADAAALAGLLACYGRGARVISSPAERSVATVAPYAALTGTQVEREPLFTADREDAGPAAERAAAIAAAGQPTVICAHRENLPVLLGVICRRLGAPPPAGPQLRKGGFWVLHVAGERLVAAEHQDGAQRPAPVAG
ncbi:MAG: NUDIX domain-containing protein [Streptosporangiaceae bacterium]